MSIERNIQTSKDFFAAIGRGDRKALSPLVSADSAAQAGKIKAMNQPFEDGWIFAMTARDGRLSRIREHIDTQALARAAQNDASKPV